MLVVPNLVGWSSILVKYVEVCICACSLVVSCSHHWASFDVLVDGSCKLFLKLKVAPFVRIVVGVAILNQDFVKVAFSPLLVVSDCHQR
jgi:hypothetical protein